MLTECDRGRGVVTAHLRGCVFRLPCSRYDVEREESPKYTENNLQVAHDRPHDLNAGGKSTGPGIMLRLRNVQLPGRRHLLPVQQTGHKPQALVHLVTLPLRHLRSPRKCRKVSPMSPEYRVTYLSERSPGVAAAHRRMAPRPSKSV